nr:reverse transcriptase domain-containing protein [Tanacetum cinerariifolium]
VDYESDPRVPLILGRPFLRTTRALIDVHGEEMILRDGDEWLTLNIKHDTASYSNHPYRESVNLINIFNLSSEDCLKDLVSNKQNGNPTFSLHKEIALPEVIPEFHDSKGCEDSDFKDSIDQSVLTHRDDLFVDPTPKMFAEEQPHDYSFPPRFDGEKIKEVDLLIDQLDLPCDILSEYDSFNSQDFSKDDVLFSPNNEDKVFNPGILSREKSVKIITRFTQEKKLAVSFASWLFEDFDSSFYELLVFKEVPISMRLLP